MRILLLVFILLFMPLCSFAGYIVGGEIYYDNLGAGKYMITLKVYRDCFNSSSFSFDNPATITIRDNSGQLIQNLQLPFTGTTSVVPPAINNPCFTPPPNICVDYATYQGTVTLPPKTGGYYLVYQRCCRNPSILNLNNPSSTGSSFMEHIPGPEVVAGNSCPRFNSQPPDFTCASTDINFNYRATDPDGDSLVYSLCDPSAGLGPCCPRLLAVPPQTSAPGCTNPPSGNCDSAAQAGPYTPVSFVSPYSGAYPLSSNPAVQIDPHTGHLSGTPNITGQWSVGVCVKEYRNGVYIGTHMRDFQFNVVICQNLISSVIQPQGALCQGLTIQFGNASTGGQGYSWNFGDPTTLGDTSHAKTPSYTYPDSGKYTVTLIVHGSTPGCADTSQQVFTVYPLLAPSFVRPAGQCVMGNSFNFAAGGFYASYSTFQWNFSPGIPSSSTQPNPTGITYAQPGKYLVVLTVKEKSCTKAYTDTIQVYPLTRAQFHVDSSKGCQPLSVSFLNQSQYGTGAQFLWSFGDGTTSTNLNPVHMYRDTGIFNVTLTVTTTSGCAGTSTVTVNGMIHVLPGPKTGFIVSPTHTDIYNPLITFTDTSKNVINQVVTMGDGTTLNYLPATHEYQGYGQFTVTQIAISSNGCSDTTKYTVFIDKDYTFYVPNSFSPNGDSHNPVFKCVAYGIYDFTMVIYDRWGTKLFESNDPEQGWDGMYRGKACKEDVYVYRIDFTNIVDEYPHTVTGQLHLIK